MSDIEDIASVHLGKAGDGTVVKPYITPDAVDPSLLVGIPRSLNRTEYGIEEEKLPFKGSDTWNCYEFSTLTNNGFPVSGLLKIIYPADSVNIVESKSLKLYLNSYNMVNNGSSIDAVVQTVESSIRTDLMSVLGARDVTVVLLFEDDPLVAPITGDFVQIEKCIDPLLVTFNQFTENSDILQVEESLINNKYQWRSSVLRSNCRVTNQPDWGDVYIAVRGSTTVTPESLLQYIVSMRSENHFHEEICEMFYKRLWDLLSPEDLFVACLYTRRGGIDINPVRASSNEVLNKYSQYLRNGRYATIKTLRQ